MEHALTRIRAQPLRVHPDDKRNTVDLDSILRGARRQWKALFISIAIVLILALLYLLLATKMYTGTTNVLIDTRISGTSTPKDEQAQIVFTSTALDSQVEVIKSQKVALTVINKLKLLDDTEFIDPSLIGKVLGVFALSKSRSPEEQKAVLEERALGRFADRLTVTRTNKTFVLAIEFLSRDPKKASNIANAIAQAYVLDQLDSRLEATTRASTWLRERIIELKQKASEADTTVQAYREKNDLITAGGRLINDQQLSELNSQVSSARAEVASAKARYDHIRAIIVNKQTSAAVAAELSNPVVTALRTHYFQVAKRKADLTAKLGPSHDRVLDAERQMRDFENQIFEELGRIAETYRSEAEVAKERERALSEHLSRLVGNSAEDNRMTIELRQQQQSAETYHTLYDKFLQRYEELLHEQSFTMTETRVIGQAIPPTSPSEPKALLVLAAGLFLGIAVGTGAAMFREYRDRSFRLSEQVQSELNLNFLGALPLETDADSRNYGDNGARENAEIYTHVPEILKTCLTHPFSRFADTIRAIKVAVDIVQGPDAAKVIGVVSAAEGEGKTVSSANLALFCASTGANTLLIDADLRKCSLSEKLAPSTPSSVVDVVQGAVGIRDAAQALSGHLWFLPAGKSGTIANSSEIVRSEGMKRLIAAAAEQFDYIVVDLPPLLSMVDGRAIEPLLGQFLFVVEWGKTPRRVVRDALTHHPAVYEKCTGVVLTKVDRRLVSRYSRHDEQGYYQYDTYY